MAHLIDKYALVAEIEKLKKKNDAYDKSSHIADVCYKEILSLINTLEVKEVDLEKEISEYFVEHSDEFFSDKYKLIAKHFFELGLSTQLSWKDIELIAELGMDFMNSEDSDNLNNEEYYTEILNRFKAQKGEEA